MTILEKARDLGNAILNSEELIKLRRAETLMNNDATAIAIINEFQKAQRELQEWQMAGNELTEEQRKQAEMIEEKMIGNEKIKSYMEAQQEFERLLEQINNIISQSISGQCDDQSCGPGCSGCN